VLAASGDGAGGEQSEADVVGLIKSWNPNLFLYLGDVYEKGSPTEFHNWYNLPGGYGDLRSITDPTPGNHEYNSSGTAAGYFDYWNNVPHSFSVDAGNWHLVSFDANGAYGQSGAGTPQYNWLANDLATSSRPCTLVYFHEPRYNVGEEGDTPSLQDPNGIGLAVVDNIFVNGAFIRSGNGIADGTAGEVKKERDDEDRDNRDNGRGDND